MDDPTPPKRRWWRRPRVRLSVRGLMILVLIVGGGFGWVILRAREQAQNVQAIRAAGGTVLYDWQTTWDRERYSGDGFRAAPHEPANGPPLWPGWLVDRLGPDYFSHVAFVRLDGSQATDAVMAHVGRLGQVEKLFIVEAGPGLSDAGMVHLLGLPRLKELVLQGNGRVTGAVMAGLAGAGRLQVLTLASVAIRDRDLAQLRSCPDLRRLVMDDCGITDAGLVRLGGMIELRVLRLSRNPITDAGLTHLSGLAELRQLDLRSTLVHGSGLSHLRGLSGLDVLILEDTPLEDPTTIGDLPGLTTLALDGCPIDDASLGVISKLRALESLHLDRTGVTDAALVHLKGRVRLKSLSLKGTKMTGPGVAALQAARPTLRIYP